MADEKSTPTVDLAFTEGKTNPTEQDSDTGSQEKSSTPVNETPILDEGGDLTSTVEFTAASAEDDSSVSDDKDKDLGKEKDDKTDKKGAGKEEGKTGKDDDAINRVNLTFQQSPRFQELMSEKSEMQGQIKTLTSQVNTLTTKSVEEETEDGAGEYENILSMSDETLVQNFEKDPKGFLANFGRQIYSEVMATVNEKDAARDTKTAATTREQEIRTMYDQYGRDNPEFNDMWNKGEIQAFQKANPGHTPISAHQVIVANKKVADSETAKTTAVEAAVKQAKEEAKTAQQTKIHAKVIAGGPGNGAVSSQTGPPIELTDTKSHGGLIRALTNRSLARTK